MQLGQSKILLSYLLGVLVCGTGRADPGILDLKRSEIPELVSARDLDPTFRAQLDSANQEGAEKQYLAFVEAHPKNELIPYVYFHIAKMWYGRVQPAWEDAGHVRDKQRAYRFYQLSIKTHPKDKISNLLMAATVCSAAFAGDDSVREYTEYLRLLQKLSRLTPQEIRSELWLTEREQAAAMRIPRFMDQFVASFRSFHEGQVEVASRNIIELLVSEACSSPQKAVAALEVSKSLEAEFIDLPVAEYARQRRSMLEQFSLPQRK